LVVVAHLSNFNLLTKWPCPSVLLRRAVNTRRDQERAAWLVDPAREYVLAAVRDVPLFEKGLYRF